MMVCRSPPLAERPLGKDALPLLDVPRGELSHMGIKIPGQLTVAILARTQPLIDMGASVYGFESSCTHAAQALALARSHVEENVPD